MKEKGLGFALEKSGTGGDMVLIAVKSFKEYEEMYKVVDFLNKTLKHKNLIFGLTKDPAGGSMKISIYET